MEENLEKVLDRIRKLLSLSQDQNNLNEATNALAQAHKILERYKLTMADVELSQNLKAESIVEASKPIVTSKRIVAWKSSIANTLSILNTCKIYWGWNKSGYRILKIIGRPTDVEIVQYMYNSICDQIENLCKLALLAGKGQGKTYANNFKMGAVTVVADRLKETSREIRNEYKGTKALMLLDKREIELENWLKENFKIKLKPLPGSAYRYDSDGWTDGKDAGQRVNLSRGSLDTSPIGLLK